MDRRENGSIGERKREGGEREVRAKRKSDERRASVGALALSPRRAGAAGDGGRARCPLLCCRERRVPGDPDRSPLGSGVVGGSGAKGGRSITRPSRLAQHHVLRREEGRRGGGNVTPNPCCADSFRPLTRERVKHEAPGARSGQDRPRTEPAAHSAREKSDSPAETSRETSRGRRTPEGGCCGCCGEGDADAAALRHSTGRGATTARLPASAPTAPARACCCAPSNIVFWGRVVLFSSFRFRLLGFVYGVV
jgi:hypothetical protein